MVQLHWSLTSEASNSAYSRTTVQLQEATENVFANLCLLHFDDALNIENASVTFFNLENSVNYKKERERDSSGSIP